MKQQKNNKKHTIKEDLEDFTEKEQELIDSYMDEEIDSYIKAKNKEDKRIRKANEKILTEELEEDVDLEEFEIEDDFKEEKKEYDEYYEPKKKGLGLKIFRIVLIILMILVALAVIDLVCMSKFNKGPFFAIPVHTYDDGGTKEYYGLGYKVIKYHQVQGRRDIEIGTWALKYNVEPIYTDIIDLAIEFNNDEEAAYKKYYKQLLIVTGSLREVDKDNNKITLAYEDDGEKYSLDVVCNMETDKENLNILEPKYEISAMGTMVDYKYKSNKNVATIYLDNCFAEQ